MAHLDCFFSLVYVCRIMCALALAVLVTNGYKGFFSYYNVQCLCCTKVISAIISNKCFCVPKGKENILSCPFYIFQ